MNRWTVEENNYGIWLVCRDTNTPLNGEPKVKLILRAVSSFRYDYRSPYYLKDIAELLTFAEECHDKLTNWQRNAPEEKKIEEHKHLVEIKKQLEKIQQEISSIQIDVSIRTRLIDYHQ